MAGADPGRGGSQRDRPTPQAAAADCGERVLDVPAKLAARARVFDTGQGPKTGAADANAIVVVALRIGDCERFHWPGPGLAADAV